MHFSPFASYLSAAVIGGLIVAGVFGGALYWYVGLWRDDLQLIHAPSIHPSSSDAPAPDALPGGDPLEAAFALDAEPSLATPVPDVVLPAPAAWPADRTPTGRHHVMRESPDVAEYTAYEGEEILKARKAWHLITDNPPSAGSITWYLPSGQCRAHVVFG